MSNDRNSEPPDDPKTLLELESGLSGPDSETEIFEDVDGEFSREQNDVTRKTFTVPDRVSNIEDIAAAIDEVESMLVIELAIDVPSEKIGIGQIVGGRYQIESVLSTTDFVVIHIGVHQRFALRLLSNWTDEVEDHLRKVSRVSGLLAHESLGFVTDVGICPRFGAFVVSEHAEGTHLRALLDMQDQWELEEALDFAIQVGSALDAMHEVGVAHGLADLDDIQRSSSGVWKLLRPGVPASDNALQDHLPPDEREPTPELDQYALASVLYTMLVGVVPEGESPFAPSDLRADLPEEMDDVLLTALSLDPHERWEGVDELLRGVNSAIKVWLEPTVDPFDAKEASRILQQAAILKPARKAATPAIPVESTQSAEEAAGKHAEREESARVAEHDYAAKEAAEEGGGARLARDEEDAREAAAREEAAQEDAAREQALRQADLDAQSSKLAAFDSEAELDDWSEEDGGDAPSSQSVPADFAQPNVRKASVVVRFGSVAGQLPRLEMAFQSAARLRREYRRNILAAGLFVPMQDPPAPPKRVMLELSFVPSGQTVEVEANVVSRTAGSDSTPSGAGLVFDPETHGDVLDFLRTLNLGLGLRPSDTLVSLKALSAQDNIGSAEAFLLSRLVGEPTIGSVRGLFTGLPFDFDEALANLLESGHLEIRSPQRKATRSPNADKKPSLRPRMTHVREEIVPPLSTEEFSKKDAAPNVAAEVVAAPSGPRVMDYSPSEVEEVFGSPVSERPMGMEMSLASASMAYEKLRMTSEDTEKVIEVAEYFEGRRNYLAAIDVLEKGLEHTPDHPKLLGSLAGLQATFQNNLVAAIRTINRAIRANPKNQTLVETRNYIKDLQDADARMPIFTQPSRREKHRFLRVDPDLDRVWVESVSETPLERKIYAIDYRNKRLHGVVNASEPAGMVAVTGNHPRFSLFQENAGTNKRTLQDRRSKMLERAKASSDFGPWYCASHPPLAVTTHSEHFVVNKLAHSLEEGLFLIAQTGNKSSFKLSPSSPRSYAARFSPDESAVAWANPRASRGVWVANLLQASQCVLPDVTDVFFEWDSRSQGVYVVEKSTGELSFALYQGEPQPLFKFGRHIDFFVTDANNLTFLAGTNKDGKCLLEWIRPSENNERTSYELDGEVQEITLREDGLVFASTESDCIAANLKRKRQHTLVGLEVGTGSLARNKWLIGKPLVITTADRSNLEILSLHVSMLVNS